MQMHLDTMYDRVDPFQLDAWDMDTPFPLEEDFSANWGKLLAFRGSSFTPLKPVLVSPQPARVGHSLNQLIYSIRQRNLAPPKLHTIATPQQVEDIVKLFFLTYIDEDRYWQAHRDAAYDSIDCLNEFLVTRDSSQLASIKSLVLMLSNESVYSAGMRPAPKAKLDNTHGESMVAAQILAAHSPLITARYSAYFRTFSDMLKHSLKDNWWINDGLSSNELDGAVTHMLFSGESRLVDEIDFSKYDKSQVEMALVVTCKILQLFGVPEVAVNDWYLCHLSTVLNFHKVGLRMRVKFQRKSGDSLTFIGNTVVLMVVLCTTDSLLDSAGIFGGDDSVLFHPPTHVQIDTTKQIAQLFNLIAKYENFPEATNFSGKILIFACCAYRFAPDPIKMLVKLGRSDLYCCEHIDVYYISFADNMRNYRNDEYRTAIAIAAAKRYSAVLKLDLSDVLQICEFLTALTYHRSAFRELYTGPSYIWDRALPRSMKEEMQRNYVRYIDDFEIE
jgi:hypothetical protein